MTSMLLAWLVIFAVLAVMAIFRPVFGVSLYFFTYFAHPLYYWWGDPIEAYRWNFYAGVILLVSVLLASAHRLTDQWPDARGPWSLALAVLANATVVHLLLAPDLAVSGEAYFLLAKFVMLFLLIVASVRTRSDLLILIVSLAMTASYIGYEVTINDRGDLNGNRLEGIGAPGASSANELASLLVTSLPVIGSLLFIGNAWQKAVAVVSSGLVLNVILLCNSRGAFMAMILAALILLACASQQQRRRALAALGLGGLALYFLLGDPRILDRFWTSFSSAEERDRSSSERFVYWSAGMDLVKDRPLGSGGHGFKKVYGGTYLAKHGSMYDQRAVHNGFINEACEWGIQGLILRLAFLWSSTLVLRRALGGWRSSDSSRDAFLGICLFASVAGFLVTCIFGDRLDAEWGYWMAAMMVAYAHVCPSSGGSQLDSSDSRLDGQLTDEDIDAELLELAADTGT